MFGYLKNVNFSTVPVPVLVPYLQVFIWYINHLITFFGSDLHDLIGTGKKVKIRQKKVRIRPDQDPRYWSNILYIKLAGEIRRKKPWLRRLFQTVETESKLIMSATGLPKQFILVWIFKKFFNFCILKNSNNISDVV